MYHSVIVVLESVSPTSSSWLCYAQVRMEETAVLQHLGGYWSDRGGLSQREVKELRFIDDSAARTKKPL